MARLSPRGLTPQKITANLRGSFTRRGLASSLEAVSPTSRWVVAELFYAPLLFCIINSMQMFLRGVRLFVDLLDVASGSQGLMLNRYLRLEEAVMNVNS